MDQMEQAMRAEIALLTDDNLEEAYRRALTLTDLMDEDRGHKGSRVEARARLRLRLCREAMTARSLIFDTQPPIRGFQKPLATLGDLFRLHLNGGPSAESKGGTGLAGRNRSRGP